MISPGDGYKWRDKELFVGKELKINVESNTLLNEKHK